MTHSADEDAPPPPSQIRLLRWAIGLALAAGLVAFLLRGADQPSNPTLLPPGVTTPAASAGPSTVAPGGAAPRTRLAGFDETTMSVTLPSGQVLEWCVLLAASEAQQQRGLMNVTDPTLGGYDGMLFRFPADTTAAFYMKDTPMPLSIAFVGSDGAVVGELDMPPCGSQEPCPTYGPGKAYRMALEVPQGGLPRLGVAAGAKVADQRRACGG